MARRVPRSHSANRRLRHSIVRRLEEMVNRQLILLRSALVLRRLLLLIVRRCELVAGRPTLRAAVILRRPGGSALVTPTNRLAARRRGVHERQRRPRSNVMDPRAPAPEAVLIPTGPSDRPGPRRFFGVLRTLDHRATAPLQQDRRSCAGPMTLSRAELVLPRARSIDLRPRGNNRAGAPNKRMAQMTSSNWSLRSSTCPFW